MVLSRSAPTGQLLLILDVSDPQKPVQLCTLRPADTGRFISAGKVAFSVGRQIGVADLAAMSVVLTGELPAPPAPAFSPDGSRVAYYVFPESGAVSTHVYTSGSDQTLLTRPPLGGHGGPPYGPVTQLEFSADGDYLLVVELLYANFGAGPPNFLVYRMDGSLAFQSSTAAFGVWSPKGSKLYFLDAGQPRGIGGDVRVWSPSSGEATVARGLGSYIWPRISPDGGGSRLCRLRQLHRSWPASPVADGPENRRDGTAFENDRLAIGLCRPQFRLVR
jgi:hypothetical protein